MSTPNNNQPQDRGGFQFRNRPRGQNPQMQPQRPNSKDEPQHKIKGEITRKLLTLLDIKYCIIKTEKDLLR